MRYNFFFQICFCFDTARGERNDRDGCSADPFLVITVIGDIAINRDDARVGR